MASLDRAPIAGADESLKCRPPRSGRAAFHEPAAGFGVAVVKIQGRTELFHVAFDGSREFERRYFVVNSPRDCFTCASPEGMRQIREGAHQERA
jgi:hypothetical protein